MVNRGDADKLVGQPLTPRETEIAWHLAHGLTYKEIATRLGRAEQTIRNQVWRVYRKLGVDNRYDMLVQIGWLKIPHDVVDLPLEAIVNRSTLPWQ